MLECRGPFPIFPLLSAVLLLPTVGAGAVNLPPAAIGEAVATHARQAVLIDLLANDSDADGDPLTVTLAVPPVAGAVLDHGDGTVVYTPDPVLFEGSGGDSFGYQVDDGRGGMASATVTIQEIPVPAERHPVEAPEVLLSEDFDDGDFTGWTVADYGTQSAPSSWSAASGEMVQSSNICCDGRGRGSYALYDAGTSWSDYRLQATLRSTDDDAIGLVFRFQDKDNHYRFDWRSSSLLRRLMKLEGGQSVVIQQDSVGYTPGDAYRLDVRVLSTSLEVRIDGERIFSAQDPAFFSGTVALLSHGNAGSRFDDLRVTRLPEPTEPVLLEDDFAGGTFDGWEIVDWGTLEGSSAWSAASGALVQASNIHTAQKPGAFGTQAIYNGGWSWTDYRVALEMRSTDNDSIGVLFRFQDWDHFYRFEWSLENSVRSLVKVDNGIVTVLAEDQVGYRSGDSYWLEIVAKGPLLEVFLDGKLIFSVIDDGLRGGTLGLASGANQDSFFDNLRVTAIP